MIQRRSFLALAAAAPLLGRPSLARAAEPPVFAVNGLAIQGVDPHAYFTQGGPVEGIANHALDWMGAEWRFATAEARAAFEANPRAVAPAFGGYCAFAASRGYLAPTIPEAWTVYDGRLYLNANLRARDLWLQDIPGNIAAGRANWPGILG